MSGRVRRSYRSENGFEVFEWRQPELSGKTPINEWDLCVNMSFPNDGHCSHFRSHELPCESRLAE